LNEHGVDRQQNRKELIVIFLASFKDHLLGLFDLIARNDVRVEVSSKVMIPLTNGPCAVL
ncbi:hypothetical protein QN361_25270, partial [Pseudomonas sp. 5C2]|nr:hypothetical protein [Pseudomonas sp. 5C2]